ncbi:hypothetical protein VNO80_02112 [Phaseolus coccineus]|uniref:Uncharacterized protein n=1 Tax=Phaseolus coccineus TaxID=3886 RepID=A0AAN9RRG1_PHACN
MKRIAAPIHISAAAAHCTHRRTLTARHQHWVAAPPIRTANTNHRRRPHSWGTNGHQHREGNIVKGATRVVAYTSRNRVVLELGFPGYKYNHLPLLFGHLARVIQNLGFRLCGAL